VIELPFIFVAGIVGAGHCLGMCGPFALTIGTAAPTWWKALARQFAYTAGRVFTYGVLGAAAGYCGSRLTTVLPTAINFPSALAIAAGIFLVYQGLLSAGLLPKRAVTANTPCVASTFLGQFLRQPTATGVFLAGVFTGFLPCGLLYGMLALATSTHSILLGGATLMVFGLGTAPAMILAGVSGRLLSLATRRGLYAAAAWCLILTGVVSIARGVSFISHGDQPAAGCPICRE